MTSSRPKSTSDYTAYHDSGRTVVGDLVALGMPLADAIAQFGDTETMEGTSAPASSTSPTQQIATAPRTATAPRAATVFAATVSSTVPYATQCASVSYNSGKLTGYGCSTLYLIDDERTEIAQSLFASIRVRDGEIISARLAREEYLPLIASAEARVWMARPEGTQRAVQTLRVEGVQELVRLLRAA
jgi:hypothetical protein